MVLNLSPQIILIFKLILENKKVISGIILRVILNLYKKIIPYKCTLNH